MGGLSVVLYCVECRNTKNNFADDTKVGVFVLFLKLIF